MSAEAMTDRRTMDALTMRRLMRKPSREFLMWIREQHLATFGPCNCCVCAEPLPEDMEHALR